MSGLGCSGSGCGSSSTNSLGSCTLNRLRISLFCFSSSALNSACHLSFSLPSFLKLPISSNNLSSTYLVPNSDVRHDGNWHPSFRVLFYDRTLHIVGFPLLSPLVVLDYTHTCQRDLPVAFPFRFTTPITSLKAVNLGSIFSCTT